MQFDIIKNAFYLFLTTFFCIGKMSHKSESEEDSDLDESKIRHKKPQFTNLPRPQDIKRKKFNEDDIEYDSEEDEFVMPKQIVEEDTEDEEDDFQRQLRLEREEAERKAVAKAAEKVKTEEILDN